MTYSNRNIEVCVDAEGITASIGTVNMKRPKALFVTLKTWYEMKEKDCKKMEGELTKAMTERVKMLFGSDAITEQQIGVNFYQIEATFLQEGMDKIEKAAEKYKGKIQALANYLHGKLEGEGIKTNKTRHY